MLNTFGMSGRWSFTHDSNARLVFTIKSNTSSKKKDMLYYIDQRNFGTVEFTSNYDILRKKIDSLAPDALKTNMTDIYLVGLIMANGPAMISLREKSDGFFSTESSRLFIYGWKLVKR